MKVGKVLGVLFCGSICFFLNQNISNRIPPVIHKIASINSFESKASLIKVLKLETSTSESQSYVQKDYSPSLEFREKLSAGAIQQLRNQGFVRNGKYFLVLAQVLPEIKKKLLAMARTPENTKPFFSSEKRESISESDTPLYGVEIDFLLDNPLAQEVGFREGDVLLRFNSAVTYDATQLELAVNTMGTNTGIPFQYLRDGEVIEDEVNIQVVKLPAEE